MELVLKRDHRRGARNASATIPDAPRSDPPDSADAVDAVDAALLIPLLEAAAERWRASVAPDVQLYPDPPESGPWPPLSPCCDQ
jgi:hypothetical protein